MARYQFPQDRIALIVQSESYQPALTPPRTTMQIYLDKNAVIPADIKNPDGSPINNSTLYVEDAVIPEFLGPDGAVRVWAKVPGSNAPPKALYAQIVADGGNFSGGNNYVHTQTVPRSVWIISHNLGHYPTSVSMFSTDFSIEWDEFVLQHVDPNNLLITIDTAKTGVALIG